VSDDFIDSLPKVSEIKLFTLGEEFNKLYMFILLENNDILVYHSYTYLSDTDSVPLTRFKRLNNMETSLKQTPIKKEYQFAYSTISRASNYHRIIYFNNIKGKKGVFITGSIPMWFICERD